MHSSSHSHSLIAVNGAHALHRHNDAMPLTHRPSDLHTNVRWSLSLLADELSAAADAATHAGERGCEAAARVLDLAAHR